MPIGVKELQTGARTAVHVRPAVFKLVKDRFGWAPGSTCLDLGAGPYESLGDALRAEGVRYFPYDPYNRTEEENRWALMHPREYVVLSNTLNVIKRRKDRLAVLRLAASALAPGGRAYITVYHGDRTGRGRYTSRGWQENKLIHQYIPEIKQAFRFVVQCGPLVVAAGQA